MSKPSPVRYRTMNWSNYTVALSKRGSLLNWLDKEMTWLAPHDGSPGRPAVFSDAAIQCCNNADLQQTVQRRRVQVEP